MIQDLSFALQSGTGEERYRIDQVALCVIFRPFRSSYLTFCACYGWSGRMSAIDSISGRETRLANLEEAGMHS